MSAGGGLRFAPQRPGTYRFRLVAVTSGRPASRASDNVIVRATPPMMPIGPPVTMHITITGAWGNTIGTNNLLYGAHDVVAAIYDRTTFEQLQVLHLSGSANSANTLSKAISGWQNNQDVAAGVLVFLSTKPAQGWFSTTSSRYSYPLVLALGGSWSAPEYAPTPSASLIDSAFAKPSDDNNGNPITYGLNRSSTRSSAPR
jgi:hypothetical protein